MNKEEKVFGIGFHKTGTKSLKKALEILDYKVTGPNNVQTIDSTQALYETIDKYLPLYNAFQDNPWPLAYKYLDELYPNAKFILTIRDESSWIKSVVNYFHKKTTPMRIYIYGFGSPLGHEDVYLQRYNKHNADVIKYFKGRENKLIVVNFSEQDSWKKICTFLNKSQPDIAFPHLNKTTDMDKSR